MLRISKQTAGSHPLPETPGKLKHQVPDKALLEFLQKRPGLTPPPAAQTPPPRAPPPSSVQAPPAYCLGSKARSPLRYHPMQPHQRVCSSVGADVGPSHPPLSLRNRALRDPDITPAGLDGWPGSRALGAGASPLPTREEKSVARRSSALARRLGAGGARGGGGVQRGRRVGPAGQDNRAPRARPSCGRPQGRGRSPPLPWAPPDKGLLSSG